MAKMEVHFLPWDDRLASLYAVYGIWAPIMSGHPVNTYTLWALYFTNKDILPESPDYVEKCILKIVKGEELSEAEEKYVEEVVSLSPPSWMRKAALEQYEVLKEEFKSVEDAMEKVVARAFGDVFHRPIYIFPCVWLGGSAGSVMGDVIALCPNAFKRDVDNLLFTFVHELLHIFHRRNKELHELFHRERKRIGLPIHEPFIQSLTNIIWYLSGKSNTLFKFYYDEEWKGLVEVEDRMREVIRRWWEEGGNLRDFLEEFLKGL